MINKFKTKMAIILLIEGIISICFLTTNFYIFICGMLVFGVTKAYTEIKIRALRDNIEEQKLEELKKMNQGNKK